MDEKSEMVRQRSARQNMPVVAISFGIAKNLHKKLGRWIWPLGLATAGLATVTTVLLRGCRNTHLSWEEEGDEEDEDERKEDEEDEDEDKEDEEDEDKERDEGGDKGYSP